MSIKNTFKSIYEGIGNSKAQRFRRLFLVLLLIAAVFVYGFHRNAINIHLGFGPNLEDIK